MFDTIAPRYDLVNRVMTFGLDRLWRRATVAALDLSAGSRVLDLACGTGDLGQDLAHAGHHPVGADLSLNMLRQGVLARSRHARVPIPVVQADAVNLPLPDGAVEGAVSGFALRNFVDLDQVFAELARVVRPGGRVALLDIAAPTNPVLRAGHAVYFQRIVPRIGGLLSDRDAYEYLPRSAAYLPPAAELKERLGRAGFGAVRRRALTGGITQLITATRRVIP